MRPRRRRPQRRFFSKQEAGCKKRLGIFFITHSAKSTQLYQLSLLIHVHGHTHTLIKRIHNPMFVSDHQIACALYYALSMASKSAGGSYSSLRFSTAFGERGVGKGLVLLHKRTTGVSPHFWLANFFFFFSSVQKNSDKTRHKRKIV